MTEHTDTPITFNLGGFTTTGNITVNLGTGNADGATTNGTKVLNGTLAGNLTILNGSGLESVLLGYDPGAAAAPGLTVGGDVTFIGKVNNNASNTGSPDGNLLDMGVNLGSATATPTNTIGGSVTAIGVSAVDIASGTTVGQNVNINANGATLEIGSGGDGVGPDIFGTIEGNLTITGSSQSRGDIIFIGDGIHTATIGGNVAISIPADQTNVVEFGNPTIVGGNTSITGGDGTNELSLEAIFNGNVSLQLGIGANGNPFASSNASIFPFAFFPSDASVAGNFTLTAGNGNNNFTASTTTPSNSPFAGTVNGNTYITLGNGLDSFTVASSNLNGTFNWHSGNGNDSLTLAAPTGGTAYYNVNAQFGNGDDSFSLGSGVSVSGSADGGGRITGNTFDPDPASTIVQPFTLSNFP